MRQNTQCFIALHENVTNEDDSIYIRRSKNVYESRASEETERTNARKMREKGRRERAREGEREKGRERDTETEKRKREEGRVGKGKGERESELACIISDFWDLITT